MICKECQNGDHSYHSGPQLVFICIGCACEWMPPETVTDREVGSPDA